MPCWTMTAAALMNIHVWQEDINSLITLGKIENINLSPHVHTSLFKLDMIHRTYHAWGTAILTKIIYPYLKIN